MATPELVISNFISAYQREYEFYFTLARLASSQCEEALEQNGIRAITTFRAKRPDRLETKLQQRQKRKCEEGREGYADEDTIRADIVDLAGVRIALYFPDDRVKVEDIINGIFVVNQKKPMRGKSEITGGFDQRFDGYSADHYRVNFDKPTLKKEQQHYTKYPIEIQVASLLMHAWSEVNHDLGYKPIHEAASHDELRILDGINGIVLTGELFLQQLQAAVKSRISSGDRKFTNQYELGAFLQNHLSSITSKNVLMGRLDLLFGVLKATDIDSPRLLKPELERWGSQKKIDTSVAVSLMDHIFSTFNMAKIPTEAEDSDPSAAATPSGGGFTDRLNKYRSRRQILINATMAYVYRGRRKRKSSRSLRFSDSRMVHFHKLYEVVECEDSIEEPSYGSAVRKLWLWFKENPDIKARVALVISILENAGKISLSKSSSKIEAEDDIIDEEEEEQKEKGKKEEKEKEEKEKERREKKKKENEERKKKEREKKKKENEERKKKEKEKEEEKEEDKEEEKEEERDEEESKTKEVKPHYPVTKKRRIGEK